MSFLVDQSLHRPVRVVDTDDTIDNLNFSQGPVVPVVSSEAQKGIFVIPSYLLKVTLNKKGESTIGNTAMPCGKLLSMTSLKNPKPVIQTIFLTTQKNRNLSNLNFIESAGLFHDI